MVLSPEGGSEPQRTKSPNRDLVQPPLSVSLPHQLLRNARMSPIEMFNLDIQPGTTLKVKGKISEEAERFALNLGNSTDNLALHFNPRFNDPADGDVIVCNSKCDGNWDSEHRDTNFPFSKGSDFKFYITFKGDKFEIKLQNDHVIEFPNKTPLDKITYLTIYGDAKLVSVKFD
ncbi:uncharacterized protein LOC103191020 isoform X2 [Callorhinchus milii]|uniref:Galectin n=1 Tax=Callorhinchus milii TaxID=7868 RepID=A0A4W3HU15_CALMI|nr:uncharacterized protein LOC103191020 isoform X2 [Callorhinchus milii]|eukprot:gi/632986270/ref/XP_007910144.1/ PREDICTED: galectin-2-like isoform X2 [Callorhinchus milii]